MIRIQLYIEYAYFSFEGKDSEQDVHYYLTLGGKLRSG